MEPRKHRLLSRQSRIPLKFRGSIPEEERGMNVEGQVAGSDTAVKLCGVASVGNMVSSLVLSWCWKAFQWQEGTSRTANVGEDLNEQKEQLRAFLMGEWPHNGSKAGRHKGVPVG